MLSNKELVSVIIPTHNCRQYVAEAIESVLNQSYKNFEIIVIDDGSTDNTKEVLDPYIAAGTIKYSYQKHRGPASARNRGIKEARGGYIAFLDADDLWEKDKLLKSLEFLQKNGFDWMCTGLKKTTMQGQVIEERTINPDSYGYNSETGELYDLIRGHFSYAFSLPVHCPTMLIKEGCFGKAGLFDETILICEDTDLTLRFQEKGLKGGFLSEMLTIYRLRLDSMTKKDILVGLIYHQKVAKKHAIILGLHKPEIRKKYANLLWELAARHYVNKNLLNTLKLAILSLFYDCKISRAIKIKQYLIKNLVRC